jgi:hypothetical protein
MTKPSKSWIETHFEVSSMIALALDRDEFGHEPSTAHNVRESNGMTEVWQLAEDWTDEFEKLNEGREWDGEFYDEIEKFVYGKLYPESQEG